MPYFADADKEDSGHGTIVIWYMDEFVKTGTATDAYEAAVNETDNISKPPPVAASSMVRMSRQEYSIPVLIQRL